MVVIEENHDFLYDDYQDLYRSISLGYHRKTFEFFSIFSMIIY